LAYDVNANGAVAKVRSPWAPVGLGLITFGIYNLVWYYKVNREMRDFGRAQGDPELGNSNPGNSLLAVTLGALILVPAIVSWVNTMNRMQRTERHVGNEPLSWGLVIGLLAASILTLGLASLAIPYLQQDHLNKVWSRYPAVDGTQPAALAHPVAGQQ
jgi:hypothetical protein